VTFSAGDAQSTPPAVDEAEISIFGPGFGECIVLHMRESEWVIVDSCVAARGGAPVGLEYLRLIGVDPVDSVKRIVATHWHDDHVAGLAEIVRTCANADFYCSSALRTQEFLQLTQLQGLNEDLVSGMHEFAQITAELAARARNQGPGSGRLRFALAQGQVWSRIDAAGRPYARLVALSPSHGSLERAYQVIAGLLPAPESMKRRVVAPNPNHVSVVLWAEFDPAVKVLLGADLENTADNETGWRAIVLDDQCPHGGSAIKVPHHGAASGHHEEVWVRLLEIQPAAVVCPWRRGGRALPSDEDKARILRLTDEAYSTARRDPGHTRRRDNAVERTIRDAVTRIKDVPGTQGQVRLRRRTGEQQWRVELFGGACKLVAA